MARSLICESSPSARARCRGFSLFHSPSNAGSALLPMACNAVHPTVRVTRFGDDSAATAPSAVLTSSFGAEALLPSGATR